MYESLVAAKPPSPSTAKIVTKRTASYEAAVEAQADAPDAPIAAG